jgi:hypothetical protein
MEHAETPAVAPAPARGGWRLAALFGFYLLFALGATYPLVARARDHVYGVGTPPLNVWAMGFVLHQLPRHPTRLFDGNAFYPYRGSLAFSEHLFVPALLSAPFALASGNLVLAHNVVALLSLAGAGVGMYLLARELTGDAAASFAAGLLYAFHTWNVNELVRLQILSNQYFPFLLWALLRFFARPAWRRAALVGLVYGLQSLSCMYWALYAPLLLAPCALVLQWRARLPPGRLLRLGAGLLPALLLTGLFAIPYLRHSRELGFERSLPESVGMGRYLDVLPGNLLYARTLGTAAANQDAAHFLGFASMALALLGALRGHFRPQHAALKGLLLALVVAGFLLSLGPEIRLGNRALAPGPYVLLFHAVPGFHSVRYPERFCVFLVLGLAPLVAAGLARLRGVLGRAGLAALSLVVFIEHVSAPLPLSPLPAGSQIPDVYRWLARQDDVRVVAEVPAARYKMERSDGLLMYFSTVHWKLTPQGFTGYFPPAYHFIRWRLFHFPAPESRRFLERLGVDTVLVGPTTAAGPGWAGLDARWRVVGPFADDHVVLRLPAAAEPLVDSPRPRAGLVEVPREGWEVQASFPEARRAVDGDPGSAWSTGEEPQTRGDFYRIGFGRAVAVARVSLAVRGPTYRFPMRLRLVGETAEGGRIEIPFDETTAYDGLFARLLLAPREASLDLDLEPRPLTGLRIRIASTDPFLMPWALPEIRVFESR